MLYRKYPKHYKLLNLLTPIYLLLLHVIPTIYSLAFLHSNIGVVFSPYVHNEVNYEDLNGDWASYNLTDVKTMAKVIASRFPILITYGIGSRWAGNDSDEYSYDTNSHNCLSQVHVSEAVAELNNASHHESEENEGKGKGKPEEQNTEPLQVYQGIFVAMSRSRVELELFIAIESIQKANTIFPGTVTGIVFYSQVDDLANVTLMFDAIKKIEFKTAQYQLKIGTKQNCEGIYDGEGDLREKRKQIVQQSNFIICELNPSLDMNETDAVIWVIGQIQKYRKELKTLSPWIDVMFETGWPADQGNKSETKQLETFWEYLEIWSLKHDVSLWMNEAFDTPWSYAEKKQHWGWWKLKSDKDIDKEDGYVEKIQHKGVKYTKKTRGKAMASGSEKLEKLEKLLPQGDGKGAKAKEVEVYSEKEEEVVNPD